MDRRRALGLGETGKQRRGARVAERQEGHALVVVEADEDARHEAAEMAIRVVEEDWASGHGVLLQAAREYSRPYFRNLDV